MDLNPKKREMSRRALQDVTRNVFRFHVLATCLTFWAEQFSILSPADAGWMLTSRRVLRTYSQLKLLLSLNQSLDPELREQIGDALEKVSLNPMENDLQTEAKVGKRAVCSAAGLREASGRTAA